MVINPKFYVHLLTSILVPNIIVFDLVMNKVESFPDGDFHSATGKQLLLDGS